MKFPRFLPRSARFRQDARGRFCPAAVGLERRETPATVSVPAADTLTLISLIESFNQTGSNTIILGEGRTRSPGSTITGSARTHFSNGVVSSFQSRSEYGGAIFKI